MRLGALSPVRQQRLCPSRRVPGRSRGRGGTRACAFPLCAVPKLCCTRRRNCWSAASNAVQGFAWARLTAALGFRSHKRYNRSGRRTHCVRLQHLGEVVFNLEITESARDDLRFLKPFEQRHILDAIAQQLTTEPLTPTRHRKPLRPNDLSTWE